MKRRKGEIELYTELELINRHTGYPQRAKGNAARQQYPHEHRESEDTMSKKKERRGRRSVDMRLTWWFLIQYALLPLAPRYIFALFLQPTTNEPVCSVLARLVHICKRICYTIVNLDEIARNEFVNSFISCSFASITRPFFGIRLHKPCSRGNAARYA